MATHDYVIANASGAAVRADLNNALAAIVTNNSNATEPATTYPYMLWADTTAGQLKLRNGTNDAWIVLQELDGTLLMEDGTVAAPGLAFASDIDTGFYRPAADQLAVATNGVERVKYGTTEVVFNDGAEDYDFRIEGSTQPNLIATNAGDDTISFGGNITSDTVYDGDVQMASQNGGQLAGFRNKIINGAMQVAQRATQVTGVNTQTYSTVDRFVTDMRNATWTSDQAEETVAPDGFINSLKVTCTTAETSPSSVTRIYQRFEGFNVQDLAYGTPSAKTVAFGFWVKSNKTGEGSCRFIARGAGSNQMFSAGYTIAQAATWEYKTIIVPGNTSLTLPNDNDWRLQVELYLDSSATFTSGAFQGWGAETDANTNPSNLQVGRAVSDYFAITGVQLEVSPVATPFEHRPYGAELALCQRYYCAYDDAIYMYRTTTTDTGKLAVVHYPVTMRAQPTASFVKVNATTITWGAGSGTTNGYLNTSTATTGQTTSATDLKLDAEL